MSWKLTTATIEPDALLHQTNSRLFMHFYLLFEDIDGNKYSGYARLVDNKTFNGISNLVMISKK